MAFGKVYQFTALCFGLSVAPQVFTRVMAPISEFLHSLGFGFGLICTTGYSDVLPRVGSSFSEDGPPVAQFSRNSRQLREVSACVASADFFFLGVLLDSVSFRASPAQKRVNKPLSIGSLFLS